MVTITNYNSGELDICDESGHSARLSHDTANRLILAARMHTVDSFLAKLPALISDQRLASAISETIRASQGSDRWNLKEKFARLRTVSKDYVPESPNEICETVSL